MTRKPRYYELKDTGGDRKYYTVVPQLIWALSRNVYDFTLWCVIKMIAGEDGECWVSTENLVHLSMMSQGQVSESRKYLMKAGLIVGELKKPDGGSEHKVWHISIPDIWFQNVSWRTDHHPLSSRIEFKKRQKKQLKEQK